VQERDGAEWKKEAIGFSEDIKNMREVEPVLELIDRLLSVIQELQEKNDE
jgi:hypothetical protein